jgi:CheY-like chemotaxis protein
MLLKSLGSILVVDDEPPIVDFMVEALTDEGYTAYAATDGESAVRVAVAQRPDLILCDLHMPGITGRLLVERMQQSGLENVPVVVMTADTQAAQSLAYEGFAGCLIKPFDLDNMFGCVAKFIHPQWDHGTIN